MSTETITFEIPQDLLAALKVGSNDLGRNIRLLAAITYFQEKKLSLGKAAQLAGINRLEFMDMLASKGIVVFDYDESALADELSAISQLNATKNPKTVQSPIEYTDELSAISQLNATPKREKSKMPQSIESSQILEAPDTEFRQLQPRL